MVDACPVPPPEADGTGVGDDAEVSNQIIHKIFILD